MDHIPAACLVVSVSGAKSCGEGLKAQRDGTPVAPTPMPTLSVDRRLSRGLRLGAATVASLVLGGGAGLLAAKAGGETLMTLGYRGTLGGPLGVMTVTVGGAFGGAVGAAAASHASTLAGSAGMGAAYGALAAGTVTAFLMQKPVALLLGAVVGGVTGAAGGVLEHASSR